MIKKIFLVAATVFGLMACGDDASGTGSGTGTGTGTKTTGTKT